MVIINTTVRKVIDECQDDHKHAEFLNPKMCVDTEVAFPLFIVFILHEQEVFHFSTQLTKVPISKFKKKFEGCTQNTT